MIAEHHARQRRRQRRNRWVIPLLIFSALMLTWGGLRFVFKGGVDTAFGLTGFWVFGYLIWDNWHAEERNKRAMMLAEFLERGRRRR